MRFVRRLGAVVLVALGAAGLAPGPRRLDDVATLRERIRGLEAAVDVAAFSGRVRALLADDTRTRLADGRWIALGDTAVPRLTLERFVGIEPAPIAKATTAAPEPPHDARATILDVDRQLRARGADLLFVVVPSRIEVEPRLVAGDLVTVGAPPVNPATLRLLLQLAEAGIAVLDLAPVLTPVVQTGPRDGGPADGDSLFLSLNQHWTPLGAARAAHAVAARLHAMDAAALRSGAARDADGNRFERGRDFVVQDVEFDWYASVGPSPAESAWTHVAFEQVVGPRLGPARCLSKTSPLLLLGDSFLRFFEEFGADFSVQLARELGTTLDVIAPPFGAVRTGRDALRHRDAPLAATRTVVWVVPSTFLVASPDWAPFDLGRTAGSQH